MKNNEVKTSMSINEKIDAYKRTKLSFFQKEIGTATGTGAISETSTASVNGSSAENRVATKRNEFLESLTLFIDSMQNDVRDVEKKLTSTTDKAVNLEKERDKAIAEFKKAEGDALWFVEKLGIIELTLAKIEVELDIKPSSDSSMQDRICNIAKKNAENLAEIEEVVLPGNNAGSRGKDRVNGITGAITRLENDKKASDERLLILENQLEIANNKLKELENDISRADDLFSEFGKKVKQLAIDIPTKKIEEYVPKPDTGAEDRKKALDKLEEYKHLFK